MHTQPVNQQTLIPISGISRCDRWLIHHRLLQLNLVCDCPQDGSIWVVVENSLDAILVRTVVQRLLSSRQQQINWLERCWDSM